jgi:hypothetical protein
MALHDVLEAKGRLKAYPLLPSVRGDLLAKLSRFREARSEFEGAASLTCNAVQPQPGAHPMFGACVRNAVVSSVDTVQLPPGAAGCAVSVTLTKYLWGHNAYET